MAKGPSHLDVKAKVDPSKTTQELNEQVINRFLKKTNKENLLRFLLEKSAYTRRFEKPSKEEKDRENHYRKVARENAEKERGVSEDKK